MKNKAADYKRTSDKHETVERKLEIQYRPVPTLRPDPKNP
jgi:hypothetical protein